MNREELDQILGARRLKGVDLAKADLSGLDLREVNLNKADLSHANLSHADLSHANLSYANLDHANLNHADLSHAELYGASLLYATLEHANLNAASLRYARLLDARGPFATGYLGKHHAIAAGGYISIACEWHSYQHWLDHGVEIGKAKHYSDDEIENYMAWIRLAIRAVERMENNHG